MIRVLLAFLLVVALGYAACGADFKPHSVVDGGAPDSGEGEATDAGSRPTAAIGTEPMVVGWMPYAGGFWAADVEWGQLRFLWVRHIERLEYFERLYSEGGIGRDAEPRFIVETKFGTEVSLHAVRTSREWSPLVLFEGANPNQYPIRYLFWSPEQKPVLATSCDYRHPYSVGGSANENEAWIAFRQPCSNECGATYAVVLHRVPLATEPAQPACLFENERGGWAREVLLHPEFRFGATFLDRQLRLFEFSSTGALVREASADNLRIGTWVFWPGEQRLVFEHRFDAKPPQFRPSEIREARIVDGRLEVRTSAALDPLFMSLHSAIASSHGVVVVGQPKPTVDGTGRQLVALVRDDVVVGTQLLPDIGSNPAQVVEVDGALLAFMEGDVPSDAGSSEAPIYGFRLALGR